MFLYLGVPLDKDDDTSLTDGSVSTPALSSSERQRQRSQSLPSFDGTSAWFPSPSSAFRTPPSNEAEILRDLISRERIKRDARLSKRRSVGQLASRKTNHAGPPLSASSASGFLPTVKDGQEAKGSREGPSSQQSTTTPPHSPSQQSDSSTPVPTPTGSVMGLHGMTPVGEHPQTAPAPTASTSNNTPSRPSSSYQPFLPNLDQPQTEVAKRLSLSASRRNSRNSVHSNQSTPFSAPSTPFEEKPNSLFLHSDIPVTVRDFGFPIDDPRHLGLPAPADSATSLRSLHSDSSSRVGVGGLSLPEGVFEDSSSESGYGAPSGTSSSSGFAWDFVPPHASASPASEDSMTLSPTGDVPFVSPRDSDLGSSDFGSEEGTERADEESDLSGLDSIPEGGALYVAAYPFVPEAPQEMSLQVGEVVKVLERLCEGWVICVRQQPADDGSGAWVDAVETGLTPETYLQRHDLLATRFDGLTLGNSVGNNGSSSIDTYGGGVGGEGGTGKSGQ